MNPDSIEAPSGPSGPQIDLFSYQAAQIITQARLMLQESERTGEEGEFMTQINGVILAFDVQPSEDPKFDGMDCLVMEIIDEPGPNPDDEDFQAHSLFITRLEPDGGLLYCAILDDDQFSSPMARQLRASVEQALYSNGAEQLTPDHPEHPDNRDEQSKESV